MGDDGTDNREYCCQNCDHTNHASRRGSIPTRIVAGGIIRPTFEGRLLLITVVQRLGLRGLRRVTFVLRGLC